jgi:hypothetical protein
MYSMDREVGAGVVWRMSSMKAIAWRAMLGKVPRVGAPGEALHGRRGRLNRGALSPHPQSV